MQDLNKNSKTERPICSLDNKSGLGQTTNMKHDAILKFF